jgi:hypothetical protein
LHGAFDDVHIIISKEKMHALNYYCHKTKEYTMVMQAIFNHEKRFVDICSGQLGSFTGICHVCTSKIYNQAFKKGFFAPQHNNMQYYIQPYSMGNIPLFP